MLVFRRVIMPVAWLLVFAVIGIALIKLAFFPSGEESAELGGGEVPTGEITDPQVSAWRDTVRNDLELAATIQNDPAVDVTVGKPGNVVDVFFGVGDTVAAGDIIASVREDIPTEDGGTYAVWSEVIASASGTISSLSLVSGAAVAPADKVGAIAPSTFRVQGTIAPADRYRLTTEPTEAQVQITGGPAPFTCTGLMLETPLPGSEQGESGGTGEITTTVRCPVPADVRVFPGLAATMTIAGGLAEDVVVLPITAVLGTSGEGTVFVPGPDGPEPRAVTLGLADAEKIEIVDGLEEGEMVYEYVPTSALAGAETGL